ncbi:MAG: AsmA family protein [Candidatus Melainabacteria bacterium]|jgi:hypothetical protein|nr:AsmA family protein [Candidatus Melainabacteria bacterium]
MTKIIKFLGLIAILLLVLLIPAYYFFNAKVKDQIIPQTKKIIQEQTKLDFDFDSFRLSLSKLLKLEPSIKIQGLRIEEAVKIKQVVVELYLKDLFKRKFRIKEIVIDGAQIILEENSRKEVSLKGMTAPAPVAAKANTSQEQSTSPASSLLESLSLNKLVLKNSRLEFNAYKSIEPLVLEPIELELNNLEIAEAKTIKANYKLKANALNSSRTAIRAEGEIGPIDFSFKSLPVTGTQSLDFYLNDLDGNAQKQIFGDLVMVNNNTMVHQESKFTGDLMSAIKGQGQLSTKNLRIGNSAEHNLAVETNLPHSYSLVLNKAPTLKFASKNATVTLNSLDKKSGRLSFDTFLMQALDTGIVQGSSHGKLEGLELREVLNSVTKYRNIIAGSFAIEDYHLYFKGKNAKQINKSLKADGSIIVSNGSLYILNNITKYKDFASSLIANSGDVIDKLDGEFVSLSTGFDLKQGDLTTSPLELKTDVFTITGTGMIKANQALRYDLALNLPGINSIPIKIKGTIDKPRVYPDVKQLGKEQGQRLINDALKFGLDALIRNSK